MKVLKGLEILGIQKQPGLTKGVNDKKSSLFGNLLSSFMFSRSKTMRLGSNPFTVNATNITNKNASKGTNRTIMTQGSAEQNLDNTIKSAILKDAGNKNSKKQLSEPSKKAILNNIMAVLNPAQQQTMKPVQNNEISSINVIQQKGKLVIKIKALNPTAQKNIEQFLSQVEQKVLPHKIELPQILVQSNIKSSSVSKKTTIGNTKNPLAVESQKTAASGIVLDTKKIKIQTQTPTQISTKAKGKNINGGKVPASKNSNLPEANLSKAAKSQMNSTNSTEKNLKLEVALGNKAANHSQRTQTDIGKIALKDVKRDPETISTGQKNNKVSKAGNNIKAQTQHPNINSLKLETKQVKSAAELSKAQTQIPAKEIDPVQISRIQSEQTVKVSAKPDKVKHPMADNPVSRPNGSHSKIPGMKPSAAVKTQETVSTKKSHSVPGIQTDNVQKQSFVSRSTIQSNTQIVNHNTDPVVIESKKEITQSSKLTQAANKGLPAAKNGNTNSVESNLQNPTSKILLKSAYPSNSNSVQANVHQTEQIIQGKEVNAETTKQSCAQTVRTAQLYPAVAPVESNNSLDQKSRVVARKVEKGTIVAEKTTQPQNLAQQENVNQTKSHSNHSEKSVSGDSKQQNQTSETISQNSEIKTTKVDEQPATNQTQTEIKIADQNQKIVQLGSRIQEIIEKLNAKPIKQTRVNTSFKIANSPAGKIEIVVNEQSGGKKLKVLVETESARQELQKVLPHVQQNLMTKGIEFASFSVDVANVNTKNGSANPNSKNADRSKNKQNEEVHDDHEESTVVQRKYGYNTIELVA